MKIFFRKINIIIILCFLSLSCVRKENIYLLPARYKLPSWILTQELKIEIKDEDEIKVLNAKLWFKKNKVRIEMQKENDKSKKVIIMDEKNFYFIDEDSRSAYMCNRNSDYALTFLTDVIINAGIGRTQEKVTGVEKVKEKDCLVYSYNIFVYEKGFFCPALIKEYRTKTNDDIIKIMSEIKPFNAENKKIIKVLEVLKTSNKLFLSDKLFKKSEDIKVIELKSLRK